MMFLSSGMTWKKAVRGMSNKNFWQKERRQLFKELTTQYQQEGYDTKTAKGIAKKEVEDIMADQHDFLTNIQNDIEDYN